MPATDEQKQAAATIREAVIWMAECPVPGRSGDAMLETFQTWYDAAIDEAGLRDAYDAQMDEEDQKEDSNADTEAVFWDAVLARL